MSVEELLERAPELVDEPVRVSAPSLQELEIVLASDSPFWGWTRIGEQDGIWVNDEPSQLGTLGEQVTVCGYLRFAHHETLWGAWNSPFWYIDVNEPLEPPRYDYDSAERVRIALTSSEGVGGFCPVEGQFLHGLNPRYCTVIEELADDRACPHEAESDVTAGRMGGWHRDIGVENGRRLCDVLPAHGGGTALEAAIGRYASSCGEDGTFDDCLEGWFFDFSEESCASFAIRVTRNEILSDSRFFLSCPLDGLLCPMIRRCPEAISEVQCDSLMDCGDEQVCVEYLSGSCIAAPCKRCSATVGSFCSLSDATPEEITDLPLLDSRGCCAEGFQCEDGECVPSRTNQDCR